MKGICFIEPLFHRVVKGEKTQTRRVINPEPIIKNDWFIDEIEGWKQAPFAVVLKLRNREQYEIMQFLNPKYKVGEIVYLKEPYAYAPVLQESKPFYPELSDYLYKYSSSDINIQWKNKLFMPESAARYFIEITAVRAERLQDISDEDCMKEGIESFTKDNQLYKFGLDGWDWSEMPRTPREAYAALIDKISGKGTWEKNPFVWVYDFRLIQK